MATVPQALQAATPAQGQPPELALRNQLLAVVLRDTVKKIGLPAQWIRGEALPLSQADGSVKIEVQLSITIDEPRVYAYLSSFQASYERLLRAVAPDADTWVARIVWRLTPDPSWEVAPPDPEYWELVESDRDLTVKKHGGKQWTSDELARHFSDTNPGEQIVEFGDTQPPQRDVENLAPPSRPDA